MSSTQREVLLRTLAAVAGCVALAGCGVTPPWIATPTPPPSLDTPAPDTATPGSKTPTAPTTPAARGASGTPVPDLTFAVIGDFGSGDAAEASVARLVASWKPAFIVALGDNYYSQSGGEGTGRYDASVGAYYCAWLKDVHTTGSACPQGKASQNAFFPAIGNHDLTDAVPAPASYLDYFTLPGAGFKNSSGNERYYDFVQGPVHFFVLNSNPGEAAGTTPDSAQATWLRTQLAASKARWKIVLDHHPPYSSDASHGSSVDLQWPFAAWGVDAVLSGHAHVYERVQADDIVYFVNGLGGMRRYEFGPTPVAGSAVRFAENFGAQVVLVNQTEMTFEFRDVSGKLVDSYTLHKR